MTNGRSFALVTTLAPALLMAMPAVAGPVMQFHVSSTVIWADPLLKVDEPTFLSYAGNGTTEALVRWGPRAATEPSGYDASSVENGFIEYLGGRSPLYVLARFSHVNGDAEPVGMSGISLNVLTRITGPDNLLIEALLTLPFSHDETANALAPCPYGGANGQGVNIAGCADRAASMNQGLLRVLEFNLAGRPYTANFSAPLANDGATFLTPEGTTTETVPVLLFWIDSGSAAPVPEAGTWAMLIAGFGLVGAVLRRRRATLA